MSEKEQLGQAIKELKIKVDSYILRINKFDGLKIFYSVLDAIDAELNEVFRAMEIEGKKNDADIKINHSNAIEHFYIMIKLVDYFIANSKNQKSSMVDIPVFVGWSFYSTNPDFPGIQRILSTKFDLSKVILYYHDMQLSEIDSTFRRYYILKNPEEVNSINQIDLCMNLIKDFWSLMGIQSLISRITIREKAQKEGYPFSASPEEIFSNNSTMTRTIIENNLFPSWKAELIENRKETLSTTDKFRHESQNENLLLRDFEIEVAEFRKFPDFDSKFKGIFGVDVENYVKFCKAILSTSLKKIQNTTILISQDKLIETIEKQTGIKEEEIKNMLSIFTNSSDSILEKPLIFDGKNFLFNWVTTVYPFSYMFNQCYDQLVDNDLKGKDFEEEVRKVFRNLEGFVVDNRIKIELDIPTNIWGYKKTKTDIDVVGKLNDILFVLECKTRNFSRHRVHKLQNYCEKSYEELIYKTWWIGKNFSSFIETSLKQGVKIPKNCKFVVPLYVSNFVYLQNEKFKTVNISELNLILKKENYEIKDAIIKIPLSDGTEIDIPIFKIEN